MINKNNPSLTEVLIDKKNTFLQNADEYTINTYEAGVKEVSDSGIINKALQVGNQAPDFELSNAKGKLVNLRDQLTNGPVVLTWYRGGWCPYCNLTLKALQNLLPEFKEYKASLIALTPELPDNSLTTLEKNQIQFEILTDTDLEVARKYNLVFKLGKPVSDLYKKHFGLETYNGNDSDELPLAATYVISREGIIKYAFISPDYRERAEPSELLQVLTTLS